MHRSDVVKIYYFLVTRAEKAKGEGKKEDEIYGREANVLFLPPIGVEVSLKYFFFVGSSSGSHFKLDNELLTKYCVSCSRFRSRICMPEMPRKLDLKEIL